MKIPYGYYLNDKNEVSIDPTKADAVIMIYDMYIEGISLRKISQKLSEKGYLSPSGKNAWPAQAIDNIVCNSKYVGIVSFEKYFIGKPQNAHHELRLFVKLQMKF